MQSWEWVLFGFGAFTVLCVLFDAWRYRRATKAVMDLLREHGPLTGLELSRDHGISRSHVYLILNRLEADGMIEGCKPKNPVYEKQKAWRIK